MAKGIVKVQHRYVNGRITKTKPSYQHIQFVYESGSDKLKTVSLKESLDVWQVKPSRDGRAEFETVK